jgi:hypothetical protein
MKRSISCVAILALIFLSVQAQASSSIFVEQFNYSPAPLRLTYQQNPEWYTQAPRSVIENAWNGKPGYGENVQTRSANTCNVDTSYVYGHISGHICKIIIKRSLWDCVSVVTAVCSDTSRKIFKADVEKLNYNSFRVDFG